MKRSIFTLAFLGLMATGGQAGVILTTTNPPGSPLIMDPGTTSGTMSVLVSSDNPPNDVMSAWNVHLAIVADAGATGTLTFQAPATGTPPNPPNYIFGGNGLGIVVTNSGSELSGNDFFDPAVGPGAAVPGSPGASLLDLTFLASSGASGVFGIYALEGAAQTQWTDANVTTQFFTNVPDGTGRVRIGEVVITLAVPEPSGLVLGSTAGLIGVLCLVGRKLRSVQAC